MERIFKNPYLNLSILLILLITIPLAVYFGQKQQIIKSHAASSTINLDIDNNGYGSLGIDFGVKAQSLPSAQSLINQTFGNSKVFIKIEDPATSTLNSDSFKILTQQSNIQWHFSFSQNTNITSFLNMFLTQFPNYNQPTIIELKNFDYSTIISIKSMSNLFRIITPDAQDLQRDEFKNIIYTDRSKNLIYALSLHMSDQYNSDLFSNIHLVFDTLYDASKDVIGNTGVSINYPPNSKLSFNISSGTLPEPQNSAFLAGALTSALVTSIQNQNSQQKAPIRHIVSRDISSASVFEKTLDYFINDMLNTQSVLVWPWAIPDSGSPWKDKNTQPFFGLISRSGAGNYYVLLINTSSSPATANLNQDLGLSNYQAYSSINGSTNLPAGNQLTLQPYEVIIAARSLSTSSSASSPSPSSTSSPQPSFSPSACKITPDTTLSDACSNCLVSSQPKLKDAYNYFGLTSCSNKQIVTNWCSEFNPTLCSNLKTTTCSASCH